MRIEEAKTEWLCNPEVFQVNREEAHSDHRFTLYGQESRQSLNGTWKFSYAKCPAEREKDFYRSDFDIEGLDNIQVPGHIQLQGYGSPQYVNVMYPWDGQQKAEAPAVPMDYNPVGSYVRDIEFGRNIMSGERQYISFQGVETAFYLYVNDRFVGYGEDSFTPSEFDITEFIHEGKNRIGVEVYQRSSASWLEDQDFFRFSGIFRDVFVYAVPKVHIRDIFVHTNISDDYRDCSLKVDAKIAWHGKEEKAVGKLMLQDMDGKEILCESGDLEALFAKSYELKDVHLWSAENPYLYTMTIVIGKEEEIEKIVQQIGMRRFEMKDKIMLLNGMRIEFNGVNRHEFDCHRGRCVTEEDMLWDIKFMKQHNINAVRTCHYPDQSRWYELCDEYGIYMIGETNMETHGTWTLFDKDPVETCIPGDKPEWQENVLDRVNSMVQRDKNHPAILLWSCGNESFGGSNIFKMSEFMRKLDNSRLVHYEGITQDRRYPDTSDVESWMYGRPWDVEEYLQNQPGKPFINCEYMHAMGNSCGGIKDYTDLLDKYPMYQGSFIWDYMDQALYRTEKDGSERLCYGGDFDEVPDDGNFCGDGIVFADRTVSAKAAEVKFVYQKVKLFPDVKGVKVINKRLFESTADLILNVELLRNGECVARRVLDGLAEAQGEAYFELDFEKEMEQPGEYIVQAAYCLKEDTLWAEAGYELMTGRSESVFVEDTKKKETGSFAQKNVQVVRGNQNIGIHGKYFDIDLSRNNGGLISLRYKGKEILDRKPNLVFYRASTDNDRGCQYMYDSGIWEFVERWQRCIDFKVEETDTKVVVRYTYELPISEDSVLIVADKREKPSKLAGKENKGNGRKGIRTEIVYTVTADGKVNISLHYHGAKGLPELPLFGMEFPLKREFEQFAYYGIGPDENYVDRNNGGKIGIFASTVTENYSPYLKPQSCGNRTETRWLELSDGEGKIRFSADVQGRPFQFTALHYRESELENAMHTGDLPAENYTYVKILAKHMGVGGDDSWGSQVRENCRVTAEEDILYSFDITME